MLHLAALSQWSTATDPYHPRTLDIDGFVHCSPDERTALAVANGLLSLRNLREPLVALVLDETRLRPPVRWEPAAPASPLGARPLDVPEGTRFPHVYGPLNLDAVIDVKYARRDEHGRFLDFRPRPATAAALDLLPHPEGGWFRQTWAADVPVHPSGYDGPRATATAIYFLLPPGEESRWHAVRSDELWLWHQGGPLTLLLGGTGERPDPNLDSLTLGPDVTAGQAPQALVPAGTWQAARTAEATESLVSCVVSPGFDFADFRAL